MKAVIIGAGIAGLSMALGLRKAGIEFDLYERADELTEVGAGISLWANALYAFDQLGVGDLVGDACQPLKCSELRLDRGHKLASVFDAQHMVRYVAYPVALGMIHRATLVELLASQLPPDSLHFGRTCTQIHQADQRVVARFSDGSESISDILIGADGIRSVVREQLFGQQDVRYSGYTCFRGVSPRPASVERGYMGESWGRGMRFGVTTLKDDRIYWFATENAPRSRTQSQLASYVRELFADWADPIPEILQTTAHHAFLHNDIVDRPPQVNQSVGQVVLIGDAAHPTTPNLGQGGCLAVEDAVELTSLLTSGKSINDAVESFVRHRQPRTRSIVQQSWQLGAVGQWQSPSACWLRDRLATLSLRMLGPSRLLANAKYRVPLLSHRR